MCSSICRVATCTGPQRRAWLRCAVSQVRGISGTGYLALLVRLDDVARLEVLEVGEPDAALEAGLDLARVVLEPLQRGDRARPDDHALAEEAHLRSPGDHTAAHVAAGDGTDARHPEDLAHLG